MSAARHGSATALALLLAAAIGGCGGNAGADCCAAAAPPTRPVDATARAAVRIPDHVLVDQHGRRVRLMSDLIRGRRVIVDFVFTTCTSICPTLQTVMQGVQELVGERLGEDVVLLSISVDPATDTPERMRAFAADFGARDGWHFLTGDPADIVEVLTAFGVYTRKKEEHSAMFVLGDEPTGRWMYQSGFADPQAIVAQLEALCRRQ